jgi:hypothetical protein
MAARTCRPPRREHRRVAAILWFYFGFTAWRELHVLGWTWKETEQ